MPEFSFEKYMDAAIRAEHAEQSAGPEAQDLVVEPAGVAPGGLSLADEAKIVAQALAEADVDHDDLVGNVDAAVFGELHPYAVHTGWILTNLSPNPQYRLRDVDADTPIHEGLTEPIIMTENGTLYGLRLNIDPFRPGRGVGRPEYVAGQICDPEHTLKENRERIRYGLARLVARHELELPVVLETVEAAA